MNKSGIILSFMSAALLIGCNSSSNDTRANTVPGTDTGTVSPSTYTFIDEPVKGLFYKSATQSGCTDVNGHYKVMPDESVEFYIGKCDENNEPKLIDQAIMIGMVEIPFSDTTPYHLQVSSTKPVHVDPITVATILKTLNRGSDTEMLDLTGLLFNSNGVDLRKTIQELIESPSADASTVLNTSLYNDIVLANKDSNLNFLQSGFLDKNTVKSELVNTLGELVESTLFTAENIAGKTIVTSGGDVYAFAKDFTTSADEGFFSRSGHLTINGGTNVEWGIYGSYNSDLFGKLRINDGASLDLTVNPFSLGVSYWVVSVNDGNSEIWAIKE